MKAVAIAVIVRAAAGEQIKGLREGIEFPDQFRRIILVIRFHGDAAAVFKLLQKFFLLEIGQAVIRQMCQYGKSSAVKNRLNGIRKGSIGEIVRNIIVFFITFGLSSEIFAKCGAYIRNDTCSDVR